MIDNAPMDAGPAAAPEPSAAPAAPASTETTATPAQSPDVPPGWRKREDGQWAWKGIVDGEETELDHARAEHFLRTKESGQKRFQEAARLRAEAEAREDEIADYLAEIKTPAGLRALAKELKLSPREVAEEILAMELEDERLTPEQKELRELRERDQRRTQAEQQRAAQERVAAVQQAQEESRAKLTKAFTTSMDRVGGLPSNERAKGWVQTRIAQLYVDHRTNGEGKVHVDELTKRAVAEYREMAAGAYGPDDMIERVWADEALREKMRTKYLAELKTTTKPQPKPTEMDRAPTGQFTGRKVLTFDTANPSDFGSKLDALSGMKTR